MKKKLSIAEQVKNSNIRSSLTFKKDSDGGKYFLNHEWISKNKLDELLPVDSNLLIRKSKSNSFKNKSSFTNIYLKWKVKEMISDAVSHLFLWLKKK